MGFKRNVWIGRALFQRVIVFGLIFIGMLIAEFVILLPPVLVVASVEGGFWLMTVLTRISVAIFLAEVHRALHKPHSWTSIRSFLFGACCQAL